LVGEMDDRVDHPYRLALSIQCGCRSVTTRPPQKIQIIPDARGGNTHGRNSRGSVYDGLGRHAGA